MFTFFLKVFETVSCTPSSPGTYEDDLGPLDCLPIVCHNAWFYGVLETEPWALCILGELPTNQATYSALPIPPLFKSSFGEMAEQ